MRLAAAVALLGAVAVVAVVLAVRGTGSRSSRAPARRAATPAGVRVGANVNRLFNGGLYSPAQIDSQLRLLAATGATLARSDALWEEAEPRPPDGGVHHYDWSFDDEIAGSLAAFGIQWLPILDYSAPWARSIPSQDHSPPSSPDAFAAWAAALAGRYGAGGSFWHAHPSLRAQPVDTFEVWNEPDNPSFWRPAPSPQQYAALYLATRGAIDTVDPAARVIVGGLTDPTTFLPALLAARPDLAGQLDGVAIHPYGATPEAVLARVRSAYLTLASLGLRGVPLYVTEVGWTTRPAGALDYAPERARPADIETTFSELGHTDCGIAAAILYTWLTPQLDPRDPQDWFGISPPGGGGGPDVLAFATGLRRAQEPGPTDPLCT